jgi:zinc protease
MPGVWGILMRFRILVASLLLASSAPLLAQQPLLADASRWSQDYTGRAADPAVRFGTLPNGLRYAVMHNETPSDGVAMRMRIGSGSLQERDEEQGLAHFLEHMAFRGSASIADGEAVHMLERQGLKFGPDTNAFTAQDETVYMFNFPRAGATALGTGLKLFREIGERLTLAPQAIDAEKGVVLSEERLRDTAQYRTVKANLGSILDGTRATERWPIGKVETIKAADHGRLSRFYRANYRPDNATIVVVGNIDAAAVEQQIRSAFSDWKPAAEADAIDLGAPTAKKTTAEYVSPGAPDQLSLTWVGRADRRAETETVDRELLVRRVALQVLNQRLADRAMKPGSPFVAAQAANMPSLLRSGSLTSVGVSATPSKWREALDAVSAEQRMLVRDGIQPGELQRAISAIRTEFQAKASSSSTRKSADIADQVVASANADRLYTSDAQDLAFAIPVLTKIAKADVDASLKSLFASGGPLLFRSSQSTAAGEAQLAAALNGAYARSLGAEVKEATVSWPYTSFGKDGAVISRTADAELGTTIVKFANGTRLLVKPTRYERDKIQVAVAFGSGRAGVPPKLARALWQTQLYPVAGTAKLSLGQITQWSQTAGKVATVSFEAGMRAFVLKGSTRPADLLTQMQLLTAYARDPGFRPEAFEKARSAGPMIGGQIEGNAGAVYTRGAQTLMVGNDARFAVLPNWADVSKVERSDLAALLRQPLSGQADVVIVGDVSVDDAIKATEATFAAGAAASPAADTGSLRVSIRSANETPIVFEHKGRADQAYYGEYFILPDYFADPKTAVVADVAASILQTRLVDTVREKLGMTYAPTVGAEASLELEGQGDLSATIETPPANFTAFHALFADQIKDLAAKPVSADELERAKQPLAETQRKKLENNSYWLVKLTQLTREPRIRNQVLLQLDRMSAVSAADVQAFAAKFLTGRAPLVAIAKATAASEASASSAATPGGRP